MSRLILASNRLPVTFSGSGGDFSVTRSVGGLATALREPHERTGGLWVGWPGPVDEMSEEDREVLYRGLGEIGAVPVHLTSREVARYYGSFSNGVLWPLFHYLTGTAPLRVEGWEEYRAANGKFADVICASYRPGDMVWVHDYHLMLLPELLRQRIPEARIGFFLHIPFPSAEIFATLPNREALLHGLMGADLIGFHTPAYRSHFRDTLTRILGVGAERERVTFQDRAVELGVFPIGIDAEQFARRGSGEDVTAAAERLLGDGSYRLLLGIDRLDYTKGIPRRLLAFEELLTRWPEWQGRVRLIQVAVPSRSSVSAYRRFRKEVHGLVGRINGEFGTPHWVPIHYLYRSVDDVELSALYRAADVMLVTPVRDGMNLVAKEFVATRTDEDGVLVLSEFAGASAEMDQAILVNPFDLGHSAEAYNAALVMGREERRTRMRALRQSVLENDVGRWVDSFLSALAGSPSHDPVAWTAQ